MKSIIFVLSIFGFLGATALGLWALIVKALSGVMFEPVDCLLLMLLCAFGVQLFREKQIVEVKSEEAN